MLFDPIQLGAVALNNRMIMAPLTRCRAVGHLPNDLMATYYAQRASAGLIITECTMVTPHTSAFGNDPGIYNTEQVAGWKKTTQAVHDAGGKIFCQIWHAGRAAHPLLNGGAEAVSSSAVAIHGETHTPEGKKAYTTPRALTVDEIQNVVAAFKTAAQHAKDAGFDGVEIHAANGYLIDQFLRDGVNQRTDQYGGSYENRTRFLLEIIEAVSAVWRADRVGVRISPINDYNDMRDTDPVGLYTHVVQALNPLGLAYVHVMRSGFIAPEKIDVLKPIRAAYTGKIITNMGYSHDEAQAALRDQHADAVAFGTGFLANPDLPARFKAGAPLNAPNPNTFYTPDAVGYTDYPTLSASV